MSISAHSLSWYLLLVLCAALISLSVQPLVVHSQEIGTESESEILSTETPLDEVSDSSVDASIGTYPTEGIPGEGTVVGDFVVGPGKVEFDVDPGQSRVVEMTVTNRTGELRQFNIEVEDAAGSQDINQTVVLLGEDRGPYSIKDYVSVPHESFLLDHNQRARILVTITVPADAEPGGLYGSVLVNTVSLNAENDIVSGAAPRSALVARIGTLFFVTVPGDIAREGTLKDFTTVSDTSWFEEGPITFALLFENTGSLHLAPYGEMSITNMFGEEVGYVELDPWFVFPDALRLREVVWNREFLMGRYTAVVNINRSYDDVIDTMELTFWVLPWKIILAIFAAVFVAMYLIRSFFKNFEFKRKA